MRIRVVLVNSKIIFFVIDLFIFEFYGCKGIEVVGVVE